MYVELLFVGVLNLLANVCLSVDRAEDENTPGEDRPPSRDLTKLLTAVNDSPYVLTLYQDLMNKDGNDNLLERDPAFADARSRQRICKDLVDADFFYMENWRNINLERWKTSYTERLNNVSFWNQLFSPTAPHEYTNPFVRLEFQLLNDVDARQDRISAEDVFLCLLRYKTRRDLLKPYYISKEYNMMLGEPGYIAGRFVFYGDWIPSYDLPPYNINPIRAHLLLFEESAKVDEPKKPADIELEYLRIRKYRKPASDFRTDPLCRLVSYNQPLLDQRHRICVAVLSSSRFKADDDHFQGFYRTEKAREEAAGKEFKELMIYCYARKLSTFFNSIELYVSRAYRSNRVYVYQRNSLDGKLYLKKLMTNLRLVDEGGFDDVEE